MDSASEQERSISFAGQSIAYRLRRSARRRTIGLSVTSDGAVTVAAPPWARLDEISSYVHSKAQWILRHQLRLASTARSPRGERSFAEGETLPYLGQELLLHYSQPLASVPPQAELAAGRLELRGIPPEHPNEPARQAAVRRALEEWYKARALAYFSQQSAHYAAQLGLALPPLGISSAGQRWGSCSASGRLRFNWRLMLAPERLADYVAAHEVAHLIELNHSLRFWRIVARLMPDYKSRERELEALAATLEL